MQINNGERLPAVFGEYEGLVGVAERQGETQIAFPGDWRRFRDVKSGTIDGQAFDVLSVAESKFTKRMVLMAVKPAA